MKNKRNYFTQTKEGKMKKTLTGLLGTIVISAIALMSVTIQAQNFTNNTGGTYTANCNAVVRMKSDGKM